jgi:hypothetical protein
MRCTINRLERAGHVLTTAERRLDLPVTIWTLRHLYFRAVALGQLVIHERFITMSAARVYSHTTLVTFISRHRSLHSRARLDRVSRGEPITPSIAIPQKQVDAVVSGLFPNPQFHFINYHLCQVVGKTPP